MLLLFCKGEGTSETDVSDVILIFAFRGAAASWCCMDFSQLSQGNPEVATHILQLLVAIAVALISITKVQDALRAMMQELKVMTHHVRGARNADKECKGCMHCFNMFSRIAAGHTELIHTAGSMVCRDVNSWMTKGSGAMHGAPWRQGAGATRLYCVVRQFCAVFILHVVPSAWILDQCFLHGRSTRRTQLIEIRSQTKLHYTIYQSRLDCIYTIYPNAV
jgi:hypothetical protein